MIYILSLLVAALFATNILTLLDEKTHEIGFRSVKGILATVLAEHTLSTILSRSPSERAVTKMKERTKVLEEKVASAELSNSAMKAQATKQKTAAKRLATTLTQRSITRVRTTIFTTAGKSVPIVGTGLVIAGVAWDIYDTCETLKAIGELTNEIGNVPVDTNQVCGLTPPSKQDVLKAVTSNWKKAYTTASDVMVQAGNSSLSTPPPGVSLKDIETWICPMTGPVKSLCP